MMPSVIVAIMLSGGLLWEPADNRKLSADAKQRLMKLVEQKFDIPSNTQLNILEREGSPEFKSVTVFSSTPGYPFEKSLYITSDDRFVLEPVGAIKGNSTEAELKEAGEIEERLKQDDPPRLGPASAPVMVVMYVDFQCSYCREAEKVLQERITGAHDGKLQLLFKHHPLASHDWSRAAARYGVCVYEQGNELFWRYGDFVFQHQAEIDSGNLAAKVAAFVRGTPPLDGRAFQKCIESTAPDMVILRDENSGSLTGVNATPTFFIDGRKIVGMESEFLRLLDQREAVAKK